MGILDMTGFKASDFIATDIERLDATVTAIQGAFPVGIIVATFGDESPQSWLGGTWKKIEGRFLWASGTTDTGETWSTPHQVGGSVAHRHLTSVGFDGLRFFGFMDSNGLPYYDSVVADRRQGINVEKSYNIQNEQVRIAYTAHERHMPPFEVCNMWERVA